MTFQTTEPVRDIQISPSARAWGDLVQQLRSGIMTYDLPYQRGDVWTAEQRILLIYSILSGTPIPALVINDRPSHMWATKQGKILTDAVGRELPVYAVIDGKQRLLTAEKWMGDRLEVPVSWFPAEDVLDTYATDDGPYVRYSMLARRQGRFFENKPVPVAQAHVGSVAAEAEIYLRVNGSGTPQAEEDMLRAAAYSKSS